jgi:hypothetical protein
MVAILEAKGVSSILQPYSAHVYNTAVPHLHENMNKFREGGRGQTAINTVVRDCFLSHGVEREISACVIHKHYELAENERNVEVNGKAAASTNLDGIYPCSWLFYEGKCYPFEYTREEKTQPKIEFIEALCKVLEEADLCSIIGFQYYTDGEVGLEKTEDNISTTVMQDEKLPIPANYGAASFAFFGV